MSAIFYPGIKPRWFLDPLGFCYTRYVCLGLSTLAKFRMAGDARSGSRDEVSDLLERLNLTAEEEDVIVDSDDEADKETPMSEWSLFGKVLSPKPVHSMTIYRAMKPAWGNPKGLGVRSVGDKNDNLFIADFEGKVEKGYALEGSPCMVGKYAVILQTYDATLRPSDVCFDRMRIWVRILNLPFPMDECKERREGGQSCWSS